MAKKYILPSIIFVLGLVIGFFIGSKYKAYQIRTALETAFSGSGNTEEQSIVTKSEEKESEIVEKKLEETIELATLNFAVNSSEERQTISSDYGSPSVAKEEAKFVVIKLDIVNTTDTKFTFFPDDGFRLVDNKNREFTTYEDTIGSINNYLNVRDLSPSISEKGVIVYEVPKDAENYSLMVAKSGTNQIFKIQLK